MLGRRVLTAALGIPLVLAALGAGQAGVVALSAALALLAAFELDALLERVRLRPGRWQAVLYVPAALLAAVGVPPGEAAAAAAAALAGVWLLTAAGLVAAVLPAQGDDLPARLLGRVAGGLLTAVYVAWPLSLWPALYGLGWPNGRAAALACAALPLAVTWLTDTAAYFAGLRWGRRRLAPVLSPNKSVEGAVAGLAAGALAGAATAPWLGWSAVLGVAVGGLVSAAAQLGDLWESAIKRAAGVKDSGRLLPGHGGVLDRFDALLFALPAAYHLCRVFGTGG